MARNRRRRRRRNRHPYRGRGRNPSPARKTDGSRASKSVGSLVGGGIVNTTSGMGTSVDKTEKSFFTPTRYLWRTPLEILCVESFAARFAVQLPVRDMFLQRRQFEGDDEDTIREYEDAINMYAVDERIRDAMIAGRQYGSALLVMMTTEAPMDEPLVPERIRPDDLKALRVFSRYDASVGAERDYDLFSPTYGKPLIYSLHPKYGGVPLRVHESRVIRFDGIVDPSDSGFSIYEQDWGVSILIPIIASLLQEASIAQAVTHLVQEASIPVLHVDSLRDVAGRRGGHEATPEQIGQDVNLMKSIYRLLMLDKGHEEFERVAVTFQGIGDIMDKNFQRVAAAAEIPVSRFWGRGPAGMNATGEGDQQNYIITFESQRATQLPSVYRRLDEVVVRSAGLGEPLTYTWPTLLDLSDKDKAEIAKLKAEITEILLRAVVADEDEMRGVVDGDPIIGALPGEAPEPPDDDPPMPGDPTDDPPEPPDDE